MHKIFIYLWKLVMDCVQTWCSTRADLETFLCPSLLGVHIMAPDGGGRKKRITRTKEEEELTHLLIEYVCVYNL